MMRSQKMTYAESKQFIDEHLKELWPAFSPTVKQEKVWIQRLMKVDHATAKRIAEVVFSETKRKEPLLADFASKIAMYMPKDFKTESAANYAVTHWFIQCMRNEKTPARAGMFIPIYAYDVNKQRATDYDTCNRVAGREMLKHQEMYDGEWIVVHVTETGNPHHIMCERRRQIRKEVKAESDSRMAPESARIEKYFGPSKDTRQEGFGDSAIEGGSNSPVLDGQEDCLCNNHDLSFDEFAAMANQSEFPDGFPEDLPF